MPPFVAYHGVAAAEHQRQVDVLAPQGFRPVSLNVAGDPDDARYTAVWDVGRRVVAVRQGDLDGSSTGAVSRADGLDFAYAFNRRVSDDEHDGIAAAIDGVLDRQGAGL